VQITNQKSQIANGLLCFTTVLIKVLYVVLVLSTLALLWAAAACYMRVRRHLAARHEAEAEHDRTRAAQGQG
jgi:hypothetical protein